MDITETLKNFLSGGNAQAIIPIINLLRENSFDVKKTLGSLTPEILSPIVENFFKNDDTKESVNPARNAAQGVAPIANIADKEIVYALNRYVSANDFTP